MTADYTEKDFVVELQKRMPRMMRLAGHLVSRHPDDEMETDDQRFARLEMFGFLAVLHASLAKCGHPPPPFDPSVPNGELMSALQPQNLPPGWKF